MQIIDILKRIYTCPKGHPFVIHRGLNCKFPKKPHCEVCNNLNKKNDNTEKVPILDFYIKAFVTDTSSNKNT